MQYCPRENEPKVSPVINARYKRKVDRNVKVDAAGTLMDIANSFEFHEKEELEFWLVGWLFWV